MRSGIVSYQVVQEFFNVALRRFSMPMSGVDAEQYFLTTFRALLPVHSSIAEATINESYQGNQNLARLRRTHVKGIHEDVISRKNLPLIHLFPAEAPPRLYMLPVFFIHKQCTS